MIQKGTESSLNDVEELNGDNDMCLIDAILKLHESWTRLNVRTQLHRNRRGTPKVLHLLSGYQEMASHEQVSNR